MNRELRAIDKPVVTIVGSKLYVRRIAIVQDRSETEGASEMRECNRLGNEKDFLPPDRQDRLDAKYRRSRHGYVATRNEYAAARLTTSISSLKRRLPTEIPT